MTSKVLEIDQMKYKQVTSKDVLTDIKWIYGLMGEQAPKIYVADSYKEYRENIKKYATPDTSLEPTYNDKVRNRTLEDGISERQINVLRSQYANTDLNTKLDKITEVLVKNTKDTESEQYFGAGFEMFYSIDARTASRIYKFYEKGIFGIEYYKNQCFICSFPVALRFDSEGRLNGGTKPAIEFADGNDMFFVRDIFFDAKTWKKISDRKMPLAEILTLPNVEQRAVAIEFAGPEQLLNVPEATIVHGPTKRGNTLYHVKLKLGDANNWNNGGSYTYTLLRYGCPSTDRQYAAFVPETINDADEAMAWKHNLTTEEYLTELKVET